MLKRVDSGLKKLYLWCGYLAALCLLLICPFVLANIGGRWLGIFVPGTNEIGGYLMAAAATLGLAYTVGLNGHIRVSMVVDRLRPSLKRFVEIFSVLLAFCLCVFLTKHLIDMVLLSHEYKDRSSGTDNLLIWIPQVPMVFGFVVFSISLLHMIVAGIATDKDAFPKRETL